MTLGSSSAWALSEPELLVSVGEASGDAMAARVIGAVGKNAFGLVGPRLHARGVERIADITARSAMGVGGALVLAPTVALAGRKLLASAASRRPRAALLVGYSEFHGFVGRRLRKMGIKVLWYAPPQVWAWRAERLDRLRDSADRFAVILPFEQGLWRRAGCHATYVGHPALGPEPLSRDAAREQLGLTPYAEVVAVLPGSRVSEVRAHLGPMLDAIGVLRAERGAIDARVVIAPTLPGSTLGEVYRRCQSAGVSFTTASASRVLPAFDVALVSSGTATLECALLNVPPVIAYRTGPVTELLARRLVTLDNVGLPNIVLGERVFPELLQDALTAEALADEAGRLLDERDSAVTACGRIRDALATDADADALGATPEERVAALLAPWLEG